jgi:predicted Zn-dependent protease
MKRNLIFFVSLFFVSLYLFFIFSSCARNPVTGKRQLMLLSRGQEIEMGRQADPEITAFFGLYEDAALQRFINEKGQEMAKISHRPELDYEFKIVDSPVVNAFAVPGGFVYFTRGIMAHFNNEAEFAGVLGHEIGHITARHSAQQYSRSMMAELGLVVGSIISEQFAQFADFGRAGLGLLFLKYGRNAERESDRLGVEYSTKIGYNAHYMANFFSTIDRLQEVAGSQGIPNFLSTHPDPGERLDNVNQLAAKWIKELNLKNPIVNRNGYLKLIDGLVYGEDPRQGFVDNNVFYHPVMRFSYPVPQGWVLQNSPQQVQMAPQDGQALMMLSLEPSQNLETAASAVLQNYNLTLVGSERITVNEFNALAMVAEQVQQRQTLRVLIYLIQDQDHIYNFLGVTTDANFNNYLPVFRSTMNNFRRLTDPARINVEPDRVRIRQVTSTAPLANVLRTFGVNEARMEELAILNGMTLQETVQSGTMIKVIGK